MICRRPLKAAGTDADILDVIFASSPRPRSQSMFPLSIDSPLFIPNLCLLVAGTMALVAASTALATFAAN